MTECFVAMGSNLGPSLQTLSQAAEALERTSAAPLRRSSIYRSTAVGPGQQSDYLNAVVAMPTSLEPLEVLDVLQRLEAAAGRERAIHWGPRTLDLDLLLYGDLTTCHERLTVPHPRLTERDFVLRPLADLVSAAFRLPDGATVGEHLERCPDNGLRPSGLSWLVTTNSSLEMFGNGS